MTLTVPLTVEVKLETMTLRCDGCGMRQEVVVNNARRPDDVLLPTIEEWARAHPSAKRVGYDLGRWTVNGKVQP